MFEISLHSTWKLLGFGSKRNAEKHLKMFYKKDIDYVLEGFNESTGGRPSKRIMITKDCHDKIVAFNPARGASKERKYQIKLAQELNGVMDVSTPAGNIDILTDKFVIEVKELVGWKCALGQVISYGHYYPEKTKLICLFGHVNQMFLQEIEFICRTVNVFVKWEP